MKYQILISTIAMHVSLVAMHDGADRAKIVSSMSNNPKKTYSIYDVREAIRQSNFAVFESVMNYLSVTNFDFKNEKDSSRRTLLHLACIAEKLSKPIMQWLVNLEIDPMQKAKDGKCALDILAAKIKADSRLEDLEALFTEEIWEVWRAAQPVEKKDTLPIEQHMHVMHFVTNSFATPESPVSYTIADLQAAIVQGNESDFDKIIEYFERDNKETIHLSSMQDGTNFLNFAVRVAQPNQSIISKLLQLNVDQNAKAYDEKSALMIVRERKELDSEIVSLFSISLSASSSSAKKRLETIAEESESSPRSTSSVISKFDFSSEGTIDEDDSVSSSEVASDADLQQHSDSEAILSMDFNEKQGQNQFHTTFDSWKKNSLILFCAAAITSGIGIVINNKYSKSKPIKKNDANK